MQRKFYKSTHFISLIITLVIYLFLTAFLGIIFLELNNSKSVNEVSINFKQVTTKNNAKKELFVAPKKLQKKILKHKIVLPNVNEDSFDKVSEITQIKVDSNSNEISNSPGSKLNWLDSLVVNKPNLSLLKYAASEHIKRNPIEITDSAVLVDRLRNMMKDYYVKKYPTPVHKFGDGAPGIRIGDIINLFSSDTLNKERVKKYLKVGKYDK